MSSALPPFSVGSTVFEPYLGLCKIVDSIEETMLGECQLFFQLQPNHGKSSIKVPARQMSSRGIRTLLNTDELETLLLPSRQLETEIANEPPFTRIRRWSALLRDTTRTGAYNFLREVHRLVAAGYHLNPKEQEMRQSVMRGVVQEIAAVMNISSKSASTRLDSSFPIKPAKTTNKS